MNLIHTKRKTADAPVRKVESLIVEGKIKEVGV